MGELIREMTREDIEEVYRINRESFTTDAWSKSTIEREFSLPYSRRFVFELDGKVAGYCFLWIIKGEAMVMSFAIDRSVRCRGHGRRFMEGIIDRLKDSVELIQLDVRKSNLPAIRLYSSLGFSVVRERPKFYSDGENALVMELKTGRILPDGDKGQENKGDNNSRRDRAQGSRAC